MNPTTLTRTKTIGFGAMQSTNGYTTPPTKVREKPKKVKEKAKKAKEKAKANNTDAGANDELRRAWSHNTYNQQTAP